MLPKAASVERTPEAEDKEHRLQIMLKKYEHSEVSEVVRNMFQVIETEKDRAKKKRVLRQATRRKAAKVEKLEDRLNTMTEELEHARKLLYMRNGRHVSRWCHAGLILLHTTCRRTH